MRVGYSSRWMFSKDKELDIFEELGYARSLGFEVFGLNLDREKNRKLKRKYLKKLEKIAKEYGMKIVVRSPHHLNTSIKSRRLFSEVKRNIKISRLVGSDRLMIHPGHIINKLELNHETSKSYKGKKRSECDVSEDQIQERLNQLISNLNKIVKIGNSNGIKIALENNGEDYQFGSNLDEYLKILKNARGLKASISTGHANISGNNVADYIYECKSKIINLDLHDNHGRKDQHLPVREGNINFRKILEELKHKRNLTLLIDTYSNELVERSKYNLDNIIKKI